MISRQLSGFPSTQNSTTALFTDTLSALLVGRPADSCSERVIGELVRFNYAHVVICEAPFCTSAQAQWDLTAPSLPTENYVVHPFSRLAPSGPDFLFRRLITHTASPTLIWISSANDHTSTEAASGSSWWVRVGQWLSLKISSVRPCLSPAFIVEPFKNDTKDQWIISKKYHLISSQYRADCRINTRLATMSLNIY